MIIELPKVKDTFGGDDPEAYYTECDKIDVQKLFGEMRHLTQEECKEQEEYYLKISEPVEGMSW